MLTPLFFKQLLFTILLHSRVRKEPWIRRLSPVRLSDNHERIGHCGSSCAQLCVRPDWQVRQAQNAFVFSARSDTNCFEDSTPFRQQPFSQASSSSASGSPVGQRPSSSPSPPSTAFGPGHVSRCSRRARDRYQIRHTRGIVSALSGSLSLSRRSRADQSVVVRFHSLARIPRAHG